MIVLAEDIEFDDKLGKSMDIFKVEEENSYGFNSDCNESTVSEPIKSYKKRYIIYDSPDDDHEMKYEDFLQNIDK